MQNFITKHTSAQVFIPASTVFAGTGTVIPSLLSESVEVLVPLTVTGVGRSSYAFVARSQGHTLLSRINRMVSIGLALSIPAESVHGYLFRCELPVGTNPMTLTWANLAASTSVSITPVNMSGAYKNLSARDCAPLNFMTHDLTKDVYYGFILCFDSLAAGDFAGLVSVREVVQDKSVYQPLK